MTRKTPKQRIGIIGGLGAIAGANLYFKLVRAMAAGGRAEDYDIFFEQRRFDGEDAAGGETANLNGRKLYVYDLVRQFETRRADAVLLPCFLSHTFLDELEAELAVPVLNIMEALLACVDKQLGSSSRPRRIGVLTTDYTRKKQLFERYFAARGDTLLYPGRAVQEAQVMQAIYGPQGIKAGHLHGPALELLRDACLQLVAQGAEVIVPGATELSLVVDALRADGIPLLDANQAYVDFSLQHKESRPARQFKVGVIGGVGPAATVDFMNKIIRNTDARRDQDHIKLLVEHNPQIPDRTANLIGDGADPTIAIYSACKRLEANDANLIAIPCNTAHAYVERIQPYLGIPVVNMLQETVAHIARHYPGRPTVGLLATTGTVASGVYHDAARHAPLELVVPDEAHQQLLMRTIYGEQGVKAGYLDGACRDDLLKVIAHLAGKGAGIVILGCTELPLLIAQTERLPVADTHVAVLDPTEILARRCVSLAQSNKPTYKTEKACA